MTKSEQWRVTHWRLKLLQAAGEAGNVARTCRHFGISRQTFYKWRHRYQAHGDIGLADRVPRPHQSPRVTPAEFVSKIPYLRQQYHVGPGKIADYLKRFHSVSIACASVHRILRRHGMNRLPANQNTGGTRIAGRATRRRSPVIACRSTFPADGSTPRSEPSPSFAAVWVRDDCHELRHFAVVPRFEAERLVLTIKEPTHGR